MVDFHTRATEKWLTRCKEIHAFFPMLNDEEVFGIVGQEIAAAHERANGSVIDFWSEQKRKVSHIKNWNEKSINAEAGLAIYIEIERDLL